MLQWTAEIKSSFYDTQNTLSIFTRIPNVKYWMLLFNSYIVKIQERNKTRGSYVTSLKWATFQSKINLEQSNDYSSRFIKSWYSIISPLKAWLSDHTFILFAPRGALSQVWLKMVQCSGFGDLVCVNISAVIIIGKRTLSFICIIFNSRHQRMLCAKFGWN